MLAFLWCVSVCVQPPQWMKDDSLTPPLIDSSSSYPPDSSSSDHPAHFSAGRPDLKAGRKFSLGSGNHTRDPPSSNPSSSSVVPLSPISQGSVVVLGSLESSGCPDSSPSGGGSSGYQAGLSSSNSRSFSSSIVATSLTTDQSSSFSSSGMGPPSLGVLSLTVSSEHNDTSQSVPSSNGGFHPSSVTNGKHTLLRDQLRQTGPVPAIDRVALGGVQPHSGPDNEEGGKNKNNNNGNGSQTEDSGKRQPNRGSGNVAAAECPEGNEQLPATPVPSAASVEGGVEESSSCVLVINEETLGDGEMGEDTPTQTQQPSDLPHCREHILPINLSTKTSDHVDDDEVMIVDGSRHSPVADTHGSTQSDFHLHFSPSQSQSYINSCQSMVQLDYQQQGFSDRHSPILSQPPGSFCHTSGLPQTTETQVPPASGWRDRANDVPQGEEKRAMRLGEDQKEGVTDTVQDKESGCDEEGTKGHESETETQELLGKQECTVEDPVHQMDNLPTPPILHIPDGMTVPVPVYESVGKSDSDRREKEHVKESLSPIMPAQREEGSARSHVEETDVSQATMSGKQIHHFGKIWLQIMYKVRFVLASHVVGTAYTQQSGLALSLCMLL